MAIAYFTNASPTDVKIALNGGTQQALAPISVNSSGNAVTAPSWGAQVNAFSSPDQFGGNGVVNQLIYRSEQGQRFIQYEITSTVSTVLNLFFFLFEDSLVGEDQTGSSKGITIKRIESPQAELEAKFNAMR